MESHLGAWYIVTMARIKNRFDLETIDRLTNKVPSGCWEFNMSPMTTGYGYVRVEGRPWLLHRLSWHLHYGPIPDGLYVCHKCDNKLCCNPEHLFIGTAADNTNDARQKGRMLQGFPDWATKKRRIKKLTDDQVRDIRSRRISQTEFSKLYEISMGQICKITHGKAKTLVKD